MMGVIKLIHTYHNSAKTPMEFFGLEKILHFQQSNSLTLSEQSYFFTMVQDRPILDTVIEKSDNFERVANARYKFVAEFSSYIRKWGAID